VCPDFFSALPYDIEIKLCFLNILDIVGKVCRTTMIYLISKSHICTYIHSSVDLVTGKSIFFKINILSTGMHYILKLIKNTAPLLHNTYVQTLVVRCLRQPTGQSLR
jgi:hypothetical protein